MKRLITTALFLAAGCAASSSQNEATRSNASAASAGGLVAKTIPAGSAPAVTSGSDAAYGGGAVLPAVRIVAVFWGPNVSPVVTSGIGGFYQAVTANAYLDKLDEYYSQSPVLGPIGRGTYGGAVTITPGNKSTSLSDSDIQTELAAQIGARSLPQPDANTLYMVHFPPGVVISAFGELSCVQFCAYHEGATSKIDGGSPVTFQYGVMPDFSPGSGCDLGCGAGTEFQNITSTASHEMSEAITDPQPFSGWSPEIGDPCNQLHDTITSPSGTQYTVQKTWSNTAQACITTDPDCQGASDTYGIVAGSSWGFAPAEVQTWWKANGCSTSPASSANLCQKASEIYGIAAGNTFGYAPASVQTWWKSKGCATSPLTSDGLCQRASDTYGIVPGQTWGSAPATVQSWWTQSACTTTPRAETACQLASELYGIVSGKSWGDAPAAVQSWWTSSGCAAVPVGSACQDASDRYGIVAGQTFGFAPSDVQAWWNATGCTTKPVSSDTCQRASELYGIVGGTSWGFAPASVQTWWTQNGCTAKPLFSEDTCQRASNTYGIVGGSTFAFATPDVQTWWTHQGCTSHPHTVTKNFQ